MDFVMLIASILGFLRYVLVQKRKKKKKRPFLVNSCC